MYDKWKASGGEFLVIGSEVGPKPSAFGASTSSPWTVRAFKSFLNRVKQVRQGRFTVPGSRILQPWTTVSLGTAACLDFSGSLIILCAMLEDYCTTPLGHVDDDSCRCLLHALHCHRPRTVQMPKEAPREGMGRVEV